MDGRVTRLLAAFTVATLPWTGASAAEEFTGVASVIDGDTLEIHGTRIRLHGIDAPESNQLCEANGKRYRCGQQAALALSDRIERQTVSCSGRDRDRYGRVVAVCMAGGDLNGWMVAEGWALAYRQYSTDYIPAELEAHARRKGMWQGNFVEPWNWRRGARLEKTAVPAPAAGADLDPAASGDCRIKGNINRNGDRIYHVPGSTWYERTRISTAKGERWFCSEAEARSAGWRAPRG